MIRQSILFAMMVTGAVLAVGCSTHANRLCGVRDAYYAGDLKAAQAKIDAAVPKFPKEADVLKLERASVLLSAGQVQEAEKLLREIRDRFDHLEQKDLAEGALAMLTDDQQLAYHGEDYEKVLIRVFLALANLLGDGGDADAYALQVSAKQQQIIETGKGPDDKNPKENYKQVAVGAYIQAALREQTHTNYDDAARSIERVCAWAPEFSQGKHDLERVRSGRHSGAGHGVVYVFTLVGRGPHKEEAFEVPTSAALLVADRIISLTAKHSVPPTLAPIKVPRVLTPVNEVSCVRVAVDGKAAGQTDTITDVGRMAAEQSEALRSYVLGRAVARRAIKKAAVYGAKEAVLKKDQGLGELAFDVAGVVWEATEAADTRCWGLLPDKIQVLRLELPAGPCELALQPLRANGAPLGSVQSIKVDVADGRNTYVLANFPTANLVGRIVCNAMLR